MRMSHGTTLLPATLVCRRPWTTAHLASVVVFVTAFACRSSVGLPDRDVEIALVRDSALAYVDDATIELQVQVVVRNHDTRNVFLSRCGHIMQRQTDSGWTTVLSVPCLHAGNALVVSPNTGAFVGLGVLARRDTLHGRWPEDVAGNYRVIVAAMGVLAAGGGGTPLPTPTRTSPTFRVVVRTVPPAGSVEPGQQHLAATSSPASRLRPATSRRARAAPA